MKSRREDEERRPIFHSGQTVWWFPSEDVHENHASNDEPCRCEEPYTVLSYDVDFDLYVIKHQESQAVDLAYEEELEE